MTHLWAIVLAGGSGTRLAVEARRRYGYPRPKQFCDFDGRGTLLEQTIGRATQLVSEDRVVVVTTRAHRAEALESLTGSPRVAHLEQPYNRDTGPGLLFPVLHVLRSDPDAIVVVLPSDHHVADPIGFSDAVASAAASVRERGGVVLLGAVPDRFEEGYGWIVPGDDGERVAAFCEKPPAAEVERLVAAGALANTFVLVGPASTFSALCARWEPAWWTALLDPENVEPAYDALPGWNFSTGVLANAVHELRVMPLGDVGWTDVGTPDRLWRTLDPGPRCCEVRRNR